jgi:hypothetical protein
MQQRSVAGIALVLSGGLLVGTAAAEEDDAKATRSGGVHVSGGFDVAYAIATGPLARAFDHGWGGTMRASLHGGQAPLGLAVEGWLVQYGHESEQRRLFADTGRIMVDLATDNWIGHLSLGPELAVRKGRVQPYAKALVGFSYFATSSSVEGSADEGAFATTTHIDDWRPSASIGVGLRVPLRRESRVALDVNARYVWNGTAEYLVEGDIREAADGQLLFEPRRSRADLVVIGLGLTFGR